MLALSDLSRTGDEIVKLSSVPSSGDNVSSHSTTHHADTWSAVRDLLLSIRPQLQFLSLARSHLQRIPRLDPNSRIILFAGCPNAGKSTLINILSRANVEMQPFAKEDRYLFVGETDYKYLSWKVVDGAGTLDKPLETNDSNVDLKLAMSFAHLQCVVVFVIDVSESCGMTVEEQADILLSLRPVVESKPLIVAFSKSDLRSIDDLSPAKRELLISAAQSFPASKTCSYSALDGDVMALKSLACDALLERRISIKTSISGAEN
eukprot:TRINITY_DN1152_c0_g1_i3.p1 TRINITY_DN1152_c0_g1~~TRINITY_DN1152_c0_g1_i3.p1  ORF type:complete len:263 (+),score=28.58 TRINITY_DN1152_c0_g1_i3:464-1252(+)